LNETYVAIGNRRTWSEESGGIKLLDENQPIVQAKGANETTMSRTQFSLRIPDDRYDALLKLAEKEEISVNFLINRLLRDYLAANQNKPNGDNGHAVELTENQTRSN
jgi:hypothetical protein